MHQRKDKDEEEDNKTTRSRERERENRSPNDRQKRKKFSSIDAYINKRREEKRRSSPSSFPLMIRQHQFAKVNLGYVDHPI